MGALLLGLDGATLTTNRRFRELMHGSDDPVEEPLFDRVHPDDVAGARSRFDELTQGDKDRFSCDLRLVNDDGDTCSRTSSRRSCGTATRSRSTRSR
jgi:hypothetical protein